MKRYLLHSPFSIYRFETDVWVHSVHNHSYFEIIFISKGFGVHNINGNAFRYEAGDVFLLGPEDFHNFSIEETTEFCFVRFNDTVHSSLIEEKGNLITQLVNSLLYTASQSRGTIVNDKLEKRKLFGLLAILESENESDTSKYFDMLRTSLLQSILVILARNLLSQNTSNNSNDDGVERLLMYVKKHIYEPEKLTIAHLAEVFNYAPDYVSIYFKRHYGESLKQYITKYKMKLIEIRLLYSQLTVAQIADEFGYLDESHFCKQFKKFSGTTPTSFRKAK
ncbi:MAG TPA: AraC family transcriptional regulator [Leadbetterella sp.]|nr:AraC family transcriptional regulator [Leadbetterella sp.]